MTATIDRAAGGRARCALEATRVLPELNPVAAGLAGAVHLRFTRYLTAAAGSALIWAGTWIGVGHLAGEALEGIAGALDISCVLATATVLGAAAMSAAILMRRLPAGRGPGRSAGSLTALGHAARGPRTAETPSVNDHQSRSPTPNRWGPTAHR